MCGLRTQSILPCNPSYTAPFLLLIITPLPGGKQARSAENSNLTLLLQNETQQDWSGRVQDSVLPLQGERQGAQ